MPRLVVVGTSSPLANQLCSVASRISGTAVARYSPARRQPGGEDAAGDVEQPRQQQVVAGDGVNDPESVGVQRIDPERLAADPLAAGDAPRPQVVVAGVERQGGEERRAAKRQ